MGNNVVYVIYIKLHKINISYSTFTLYYNVSK